MNDAIAAIALGRRIDLTREADFIVGGARIRPTACEVIAGDRRVRLQPRVMQVLIALARAGGEPVSREALIEVCWGQVTVGEDALNRCIQRLRRLAETETRGAFVIETIPRLGYRLAPHPAAARETGAPPVGARSRRARLIVAGSFATIAAIALAAVATWNARPARWSIERSERLVSTPLLERHPAISPDGTMLAYSAGPDVVSRHIYFKRLSGGESIQLTDDPYDDIAPAWSPDGARIVYTTYRAGEPCRILITAVPAGLAREVGRCRTARRSRAVWSPAGDALLFVDAAASTASEQVMRLDLASGRRRAISHPPGGFDDIEPTVSPDGRWVMFARTSIQSQGWAMAIQGHPAALTIQDLKTGREHVVAQVPQPGASAAWSEDSESVFVVDAEAEGSTLWSYPIDGGPRVSLVSLPLEVGRLASGRGGLLAAEVSTGRVNVARPPISKNAAPQVVDPANGPTWSIAYSSDGILAMISERSGEFGIWLMRPGARSRMLLNLKNTGAFGVSWSPDAADLAFVAFSDVIAVRIVSAAGEELAKVPVSGAAAGRPAWTADGRSLLFPVRDGRGWRLWRADLAHPGAPYPVTGYGWASVRIQGDALYGVRSGQPGLWRIGPKPELITAMFSGLNPEAWDLFKDQIVFADDSDPGHQRLLSVSVSGGAPRPFADIPQAEYGMDFAIDPGSETPVYTRVISADSDIELFHLARR